MFASGIPGPVKVASEYVGVRFAKIFLFHFFVFLVSSLIGFARDCHRMLESDRVSLNAALALETLYTIVCLPVLANLAKTDVILVIRHLDSEGNRSFRYKSDFFSNPTLAD